MPYFVFRISPPMKLSLLDAFPAYRDARQFARAQRTEPAAEDAAIVKVIFAPNEAQARTLLQTKREPRPLGEDA